MVMAEESNAKMQIKKPVMRKDNNSERLKSKVGNQLERRT